MRKRVLGRTGLAVSEIGIGTWAMGGFMWGGPRDAEARAALERAYELGCNFVDTALVYGNGHAERLVGEFLHRHRDVAVATKVPPKTLAWPAPPRAKLAEFFPPAWVVRSCENSLRHLGVERIDLFQLHVWADAWTDEEAWHTALDGLKRDGKIQFIGISVNAHEPSTAVRVVRSGLVDAVQVVYNVFDQSPEDELFPACSEERVGVLARVPFDEGSLTGKFHVSTRFAPGDFRAEYFGGGLLEETVRRVEAVRPILTRSAPSMARGALRFCLSHPAVSTVIPGIRSRAQADENCAASEDGPLPPELLEQLRTHRWLRPTI